MTRALFFLMLLLCVVQMVFYYSHLPEQVASHFDAGGRPNGWMSREGLMGSYAAIALLMTAVFIGLPSATGRLPPTVVNIPHRDYWLAPEHITEARAKMVGYMAFFGTGVLLFLALIFGLVFEANIKTPDHPQLPLGIPYIVGFFTFVVAWLVLFLRAFRVPAARS